MPHTTTPLPLVIATRESRLALAQSQLVANMLHQHFGFETRLLGLTTQGDRVLDRALSQVGGKGVFVKELETALQSGQAQLAVHSLKDVPMTLPDGFVLAAVLPREDPRDAFVSNRYATFDALPIGSTVGTSSLRRQVLLRALRPDLRITMLRGNLNTRLRKLDEGEFDAIVLAAAGLKRLGMQERIRMPFTLTQMIPSAGQGALGLEAHESEPQLIKTLGALNDVPTLLACTAERAVSRALGGSCSVPLAAHAFWSSASTLEISAAWGDIQGQAPLLRSIRSSTILAENTPLALQQARTLGEKAAADLTAQGRQLGVHVGEPQILPASQPAPSCSKKNSTP